MGRARKLLAMRLLLTVLIFGSARRAPAQEPPPDLKMLLNLDLFSAAPQDSAGASPASGASGSDQASMLDQIRTLDALGYLHSAKDKLVANPPTDNLADSPSELLNLEVQP